MFVGSIGIGLIIGEIIRGVDKMGREVRKVAPNYEHPKDGYGDYIPLFDNFGDSLKEFEEYKHEHGLHAAKFYYGRPRIGNFMLAYAKPEERTWLQFFENVSEGTPCSPPFATEKELINYLCTKGSFYHKKHPNTHPVLSRKAAEKFVCNGYAPSFAITNGVFSTGTQALENDEQKSS